MPASKCNATFKELFSFTHWTFKSKRVSTWFLLDLTFSHSSVLMLKRVFWKYQIVINTYRYFFLKSLRRRSFVYLRGVCICRGDLLMFFKEHLLKAASKTHEFKHIHQISKRDSISLVFKELLKWVNRVHHKTLFLNFLDNIVLSRNSIN